MATAGAAPRCSFHARRRTVLRPRAQAATPNTEAAPKQQQPGVATAAEAAALELTASLRQGASTEISRCVEALRTAEESVASLHEQQNKLFADTFAGVVVPEEGVLVSDAASFSKLGRDHPTAFTHLLADVRLQNPAGFATFQREGAQLAQRLATARAAVATASAALEAAQHAVPAEAEAEEEEADKEAARARGVAAKGGTVVLVCGFESFNTKQYRNVGKQLSSLAPGTRLLVFSDRDIGSKAMEEALASADAVVLSLLFDFDQNAWLRDRIQSIPVRLVFESSLELMECTQCGTFTMKPGAGGARAGPPPFVKALLNKFSSGREEDKMGAYTSLLKIAPTVLRFVPDLPGLKHLKNWLTIYSKWSAGGPDNVLAAFQHLAKAYLGASPPATAGPTAAAPSAAAQQQRRRAAREPRSPSADVPTTGCFHPSLFFVDAPMIDPPPGRFISSPAEYLSWYRSAHPGVTADAPVVAVLLYRKHVVSRQPYLATLVRCLEGAGVIPLPIFISGVEAHAVVRDCLTSTAEVAARAAGRVAVPSLRRDAARVDAVVSTIGFPLVGGPAGSMEGGRQADVATAILTAKDVPYIVASPLLLQPLSSWVADGISALQGVILYALPELDGAIDPLPLGGLASDDIFLCPERVGALGARLRAWAALRRSPNAAKRVAVVVYGFPPGVGAVGTAALLDVPASIDSLLRRLRDEGYDLGVAPCEELPSGHDIVAALTLLEAPGVAARGLAGAAAALAKAHPGLRVAGADVGAATLASWLSFPPDWGPGQWGPIPYLPDPAVLVARMQAAWGELRSYTGIRAVLSGGPSSLTAQAAEAKLSVAGIAVGNVYFGVQPALGLEGDPMRLLFERDLTPHPQYAAFYKWIAAPRAADDGGSSEGGWGAHALVHVGAHGTAEWLPGCPLGTTALSWPEVLLGSLPNIYVYTANNPAEAIIAKRRGYATIVSHMVPPYGRAGLYAKLADAKALLAEWRDATAPSSSRGEGEDAAAPLAPNGGGEPGGLRAAIAGAIAAASLASDVPFLSDNGGGGGGGGRALSVAEAEALPFADFDAYVSKVSSYLSLLENRIFSEGLHVLGRTPSAAQLDAYIDALRQGSAEAAAAGVGSDGGDGGDSSGAAAAAAAAETEALVRSLLEASPRCELDAVVAALRGGFVPPAPGGDVLRDGAGCLPTGRNIHALDPYRMPTPAALARGAAAAEGVLAAHLAASPERAWPETVSVNLWGLDAIKTKGESVGLLLSLVGATPVRESTGRVVRYELKPLSALGGRPRIDVLANVSGIFRDSFSHVIELIDDMFGRAAAADEPPEMNYIKKHALAAKAKGLDAPSARLFSNPAGDYGSMVNERVGTSDWASGDELGDTWAARNAFSFGRGAEKGTARPELLKQLLSTTERVVQTVDSVEYGLTDIQEYFANTGALVRAAKNARGGAPVGCSIVEAFGRKDDGPPKELEDVLRIEYRTKLLNPRWASAMAAQGSGGAFEIAQRFQALVGWGGTTGYADDFVYDEGYARYVDDEVMAQQLKKANPAAWANISRRMLEASRRGMWHATPDKLSKLQTLYEEADALLEGVQL